MRVGDKATAGALVLLVPSTVDAPGSITEIRRDQSNTDGSFEMDDVIPGQYILVAIEHGWQMNWNNVATLRVYLIDAWRCY